MEQKVCLITGATGFVGQYILNELIASGRKVLALGDSEDAFSPLAANNRLIKATSALPISAAAFKEHNVQFCFGDIADISFLASIFNTAAKNGIEIEFVLHLAAVRKGRRAVSSDGTANLLEVCRAYWQSNPDTPQLCRKRRQIRYRRKSVPPVHAGGHPVSEKVSEPQRRQKRAGQRQRLYPRTVAGCGAFAEQYIRQPPAQCISVFRSSNKPATHPHAVSASVSRQHII